MTVAEIFQNAFGKCQIAETKTTENWKLHEKKSQMKWEAGRTSEDSLQYGFGFEFLRVVRKELWNFQD